MIHMTTATQLSDRLANAIRDAASSAGVSQRELASRTGIPLVTLNRKLNHSTPFNAIELGAISEALGTSLVDLALKAERQLVSA
jgi:transcriptional regulator with XRE-family HTH domain